MVKLARFQAGRPARKKIEKQKRAAARRRKRSALLVKVRAALGYKKLKLTPDHLAALAEGRRKRRDRLAA